MWDTKPAFCSNPFEVGLSLSPQVQPNRPWRGSEPDLDGQWLRAQVLEKEGPNITAQRAPGSLAPKVQKHLTKPHQEHLLFQGAGTGSDTEDAGTSVPNSGFSCTSSVRTHQRQVCMHTRVRMLIVSPEKRGVACGLRGGSAAPCPSPSEPEPDSPNSPGGSLPISSSRSLRWELQNPSALTPLPRDPSHPGLGSGWPGHRQRQGPYV